MSQWHQQAHTLSFFEAWISLAQFSFSKLLHEVIMTKNGMYSIPWSCGKEYKHKAVRKEDHQKNVEWREMMESSMVDHQPLSNEVKIIDKSE